ncbi:MAG: Gx transporter family protein [Eubacterium sp.]|nr:Gx transporter family protein [Eubacterium sp.]
MRTDSIQKPDNKKTKKSPAARVAYAAVFIALAMIFSYVETLIPINFAVPGIKLGLANLVIMVGLFLMPAGEVLIISVARILLVGFLFGNGASILYSLAGGLLSFVVMYILIRLTKLSMLGISISGGTAHNIGQLIVAALVVQNFKMVYYLPVLLVAGVVTGTLIGILAGRIVPVLRRFS